MSIFHHLHTISELYTLFQLKHPVRHPLIAVVDFAEVNGHITEETKISSDYYSMMFKNTGNNNIRYGRKMIDFQDGSLICMAPNQVISMNVDENASDITPGWGLFFHPDLISSSSLNERMKEYSFFAYETSEALHLSDKEKQILYECVSKIDAELKENIDGYSQTIIVSNIELLLNYCTRFYARQFITRKSSNSIIVAQIEKVLRDYFEEKPQENGLPTVRYLADKVHLSASYLSDLLKKETGKNAQDHIHFYLIQEGKNMLLSTTKSVAEIAYALGFDYPQYFNKLFKQKTGKTPIQFRGV
jgi:AraC-like DNA-binding protein